MNCLKCYLPLNKNEINFHPGCAKKFFNDFKQPELTLNKNNLTALAVNVIKSKISITGVQPKLSFDIENKNRNNPFSRFTLVGFKGNYILKPPFDKYPLLPEAEDLTLHLAELSNIKTVPHTLVKSSENKLSYLSKRIDRVGNSKINIEDMCQLSERLTEDKYKGSYESVGKIILKYSAAPFLDLVNFCELLVFCYLTGNSDMHLKNFSLINIPGAGYILSPAYDLVPTKLFIPDDKDDVALTLNGKKRNIRKNDFIKLMQTFNLSEKTIENIFEKFNDYLTIWEHFIHQSFVTKTFQNKFIALIKNKFNILFQ